MRRRLYSQPILLGAHRNPDGSISRDHTGKPRLYPDPIHDAEAFVTHYLNEAFASWGMTLHHRPEDYDDSIQELLRHLLRFEQIFDPERNDSFAAYARTYLPRRAVDAGPRRILGRTGNRIHDYLHEELHEDHAGHRPQQALTPLESDPDQNRGPTPGRLQPHRDRQLAWADTVLGLRTAQRAA